MRIKICGVTTPADACYAEEVGADAVGIVVFSDSLRSVAVERAGEILDSLGPFTTGVCVTATENAEEIDEILSLNPAVVQVGQEYPFLAPVPEFCAWLLPENSHHRVVMRL